MKLSEQEKKNAKDRIMAMMNDKRQYAVERCIETMFEGENYAISKLGTQEGIDKITADNLKKHYENIITSSVIDIVLICGDADANALAEKIKKYTGFFCVFVCGFSFVGIVCSSKNIHFRLKEYPHS